MCSGWRATPASTVWAVLCSLACARGWPFKHNLVVIDHLRPQVTRLCVFRPGAGGRPGAHAASSRPSIVLLTCTTSSLVSFVCGFAILRHLLVTPLCLCFAACFAPKTSHCHTPALSLFPSPKSPTLSHTPLKPCLSVLAGAHCRLRLPHGLQLPDGRRTHNNR